MAFLFAWRKRKQILRDFADLSYQLSYMNALIANDVSNAVLLCAIDDQDAFVSRLKNIVALVSSRDVVIRRIGILSKGFK